MKLMLEFLWNQKIYSLSVKMLHNHVLAVFALSAAFAQPYGELQALEKSLGNCPNFL